MNANRAKAPGPHQSDALNRVDEQDEIRRLFDAYESKEADSDHVVRKLMALYQKGVGGAARILAEFDADAALRLGELLKDRAEGLLRDVRRANEPAHRAGTAPSDDRLTNKTDGVLLREFLILSRLSGANEQVAANALYDLARKLDSETLRPTVTAHLDRLIRERLIGRQRKGYYHGTAQTGPYLRAITNEIETRGLSLPSLEH